MQLTGSALTRPVGDPRRCVRRHSTNTWRTLTRFSIGNTTKTVATTSYRLHGSNNLSAVLKLSGG